MCVCVCVYIFISRQTFVVSQLFRVSKPMIGFKLGSKPW